jgi:hypothetical protein
MRTRLSLCYVAGYLILSGLALLVAPEGSLKLMRATADYGQIMPRWVAMMSLALGATIVQILRHRLPVLYPMGFFMPAGMVPGLLGLYFQSGDPLFATLSGIVGVGVAITGASMLIDARQGNSLRSP